jgi:hypothetical protein
MFFEKLNITVDIDRLRKDVEQYVFTLGDPIFQGDEYGYDNFGGWSLLTRTGNWELAVAKWLDTQKYNWKRNTKRFQYTNLKNVISHYTPDFWVEELNGYLEVKGYETELDRCKWKQFTENLTVWKKKDLQNLNLV